MSIKLNYRIEIYLLFLFINLTKRRKYHNDKSTMNTINNYFKLPNSEFLYEHYKYLFQAPTQKVKGITIRHMDMDKQDFIYSCEQPVGSAQPSFLSFILGLTFPFKYKLYLAIFTALILFFTFSMSYPVLLNTHSTFFSFGALFSLYFFFVLYSKTLWQRQIYHYLNHCYKNGITPEEHQFLFKFRPHNWFFTIVLGSAYVFSIVYAIFWTIAFTYL